MTTVLEYVSGIYSIIVGLAIISLWIMLIITKQIPELKTEPITIYFHVIAEMTMGLISLLSGICILTARIWGNYIFLLSSGICIYAVVNSAGYYVQRKIWVFVGLFAVIFVSSLILSILTINSLIHPV
jgi:hypothetical protein